MLHGSRSESALPTAGRLPHTTNHQRTAGLRGSRDASAEEKQQFQLMSGKSMRLVDPQGRPLDLAPGEAAQSTAPRALGMSASTSKLPSATVGGGRLPARSADGLPLLSLLQPSGLRASSGEMSAVLLSKLKKIAPANLAALSAARPTMQMTQAMKHQAEANRLQAEAEARRAAGVTRTAAYQPKSSTGDVRATILSDGRARDIEAPPAYPGAAAWKPRVVDFSGDGGMGTTGGTGKTSYGAPSMMAEDGEETGGGGGAADGSLDDLAGLGGLPPHLHALAHGVGEKSAQLRSQLRGLDLLSTAFGQLISEVALSKGQLARLLTRVKDNYRRLFTHLVENLIDLNASYHASLKGCVSDYKDLQLRMDGKVSHLEQRVRLLTSISSSKDSRIELGEESLRVLDAEVRELKDHILGGVKATTLKVEQASNAIIAESQQTAEAAAVAQASYTTSTAGGGGGGAKNGVAIDLEEDDESKQDGTGGGSSSSSTFATGSSVDALTALSHESRNLTFELSELIQGVELQQEKSAAALDQLDHLLDRGPPHDEEMAKDALRRARIAQQQQLQQQQLQPSSKLSSPVHRGSATPSRGSFHQPGAFSLLASSSSSSSSLSSVNVPPGSPSYRSSDHLRMTLEQSPIGLMSPLSPSISTPAAPISRGGSAAPPTVDESPQRRRESSLLHAFPGTPAAPSAAGDLAYQQHQSPDRLGPGGGPQTSTAKERRAQQEAQLKQNMRDEMATAADSNSDQGTPH